VAYQQQDGFAYWFPRPLELGEQNPLVILGGMRNVAKPSLEKFVDDDSTVNPIVGKALRNLLPTIFEGKFESGREPEMEWVSCSFIENSPLPISLCPRRVSWASLQHPILLYVHFSPYFYGSPS